CALPIYWSDYPTISRHPSTHCLRLVLQKEASNEQHLQSSLWVMDAYFSKTYLREIFVSLTLQKMMSNESVLCSVRPNRKIFSGENQRHYFCLENLPAFCFSIHQVF